MCLERISVFGILTLSDTIASLHNLLRFSTVVVFPLLRLQNPVVLLMFSTSGPSEVKFVYFGFQKFESAYFIRFFYKFKFFQANFLLQFVPSIFQLVNFFFFFSIWLIIIFKLVINFLERIINYIPVIRTTVISVSVEFILRWFLLWSFSAFSACLKLALPLDVPGKFNNVLRSVAHFIPTHQYEYLLIVFDSRKHHRSIELSTAQESEMIAFSKSFFIPDLYEPKPKDAYEIRWFRCEKSHKDAEQSWLMNCIVRFCSRRTQLQFQSRHGVSCAFGHKL